MRIKLISPLLAAGVVASGLTLMTAATSQASGERLYFHSANGGYLNDVAADPTAGPVDDDAPAGSKLDTKPPTKTTDSSAEAGLPIAFAGTVKMPTFTLPYKGDVTSLCIDMWVKSQLTAPVYDLGLHVKFNHPTGQFSLPVHRVKGYAAGTVIRVTTLLTPAAGTKITLPDSSEILVHGFFDTNQDFTLLYDSISRPSNVILNTDACTPAPPIAAPTAAPTTAAPTTAAPTTAAPTTAAPTSAGPSGTPSGSATAEPSETPEPTETTPPEPAQETGLTYTGSTAGRYGDFVPVSAKATLPDGSPVPAGNVEFAVGTAKATFPVNESGVASGRLRVLAAAGDQILTARYVTNSAYLGSARQVIFRVSRLGSKCAISRSAVSRGRFTLYGVLRDSGGRAIIGQPVFFAFNGRTHHAVKTDRTGRAALSVPASRGTHGIALRTSDYITGCAASMRY